MYFHGCECFLIVTKLGIYCLIHITRWLIGRPNHVKGRSMRYAHWMMLFLGFLDNFQMHFWSFHFRSGFCHTYTSIVGSIFYKSQPICPWDLGLPTEGKCSAIALQFHMHRTSHVVSHVFRRHLCLCQEYPSPQWRVHSTSLALSSATWQQNESDRQAGSTNNAKFVLQQFYYVYLCCDSVLVLYGLWRSCVLPSNGKCTCHSDQRDFLNELTFCSTATRRKLWGPFMTAYANTEGQVSFGRRLSCGNITRHNLASVECVLSSISTFLTGTR